ncbi:MAG: hypothetical protein ACRYG8_12510 [Janthinobacterium lividum]
MHGTAWRQVAGCLLRASCLLWLGGCSGGVEGFYDSKLSLDNPVDWWHQLQGGPIANERPPPPGITDPYPNLSRVPAKPVPTDAATRNGLAAQLAGQRDRARLLAAQDPVVFPPPGNVTNPTVTPAAPPANAAAPASSPASSPASPPASTSAAAPTSDSEPSKMVLEAADATPTAPRAAVKAAPANDTTAPAAFSTPPQSAGPVVSGPVPPVPEAAPPLPNIPNLPTVEAAPVVVRARPSTQFSFLPGSAVLPEAADGALRALAARRAGGPVAVSAGGDARSATVDAQGAALPLALRRTGAMSAALIAAGVPSESIRVQALAPGREATARLVD